MPNSKTQLQLSSYERTALFIDGVSLYNTTRLLGFEFDYSKLYESMRAETDLAFANFYTCTAEPDAWATVKPLTDFLSYNGYVVTTKNSRYGTIEIEMALDIYDLCIQPGRLDHIFLFTGNGNFRELVKRVQGHGVKVTVVSSAESVADELRRQANIFVDLRHVQDKFTRQRETTA